jgi:hypothetical protein
MLEIAQSMKPHHPQFQQEVLLEGGALGGN